MSDPFLISLAAALAGKSAGALLDVVRRKFATRTEAKAALAAAEEAGPEAEEKVKALAEHLDQAAQQDPAFAEALRTTHPDTTASAGGVVNQITGNVSGKVIQARDIHGDISF